jgi:hypothetical protein
MGLPRRADRTSGAVHLGPRGHKPRVPMIAFADEDLVGLCRDPRYAERLPASGRGAAEMSSKHRHNSRPAGHHRRLRSARRGSRAAAGTGAFSSSATAISCASAQATASMPNAAVGATPAGTRANRPSRTCRTRSCRRSLSGANRASAWAQARVSPHDPSSSTASARAARHGRSLVHEYRRCLLGHAVLAALPRAPCPTLHPAERGRPPGGGGRLRPLECRARTALAPSQRLS